MSPLRVWIYLAVVQVTRLRPVPLLVPAQSYADAGPDGPVLDRFVGDLAIAYADGPPYGRRLLSWLDLDQLHWSRQTLWERSVRTLDAALEGVRLHGQPPALMLSFDGLESSLLLADPLWDDLSRVVPGDVVVGVPARDVVIVTGSASAPGLARVRRAIDRMFFAGQRYPLSPHMFVRRDGGWEVLSGYRGSRSAR